MEARIIFITDEATQQRSLHQRGEVEGFLRRRYPDDEALIDWLFERLDAHAHAGVPELRIRANDDIDIHHVEAFKAPGTVWASGGTA